jgi:carbonic anhydrase/acetyltransferase-like protein (isoleucine patch superfamily)
MRTEPLITSFSGIHPRIGQDIWIDPSARLIGRVEIKAGASIWPGAVLRADDEKIIIGERSAVLDLCLIESPAGYPVIVEDDALISHKVCLHGARVESGALVGIGAIVLDGAVIRAGAIVGAGAVVPPGMEIQRGMLALGQPARIIRALTLAEIEKIRTQLSELMRKSQIYRLNPE